MDKGQMTQQTKITTKDLVLTGLLTAIVFSATMFINIRLYLFKIFYHVERYMDNWLGSVVNG